MILSLELDKERLRLVSVNRPNAVRHPAKHPSGLSQMPAGETGVVRRMLRRPAAIQKYIGCALRLLMQKEDSDHCLVRSVSVELVPGADTSCIEFPS
jgi:hypothetical protein